jgi:hypothetical protein
MAILDTKTADDFYALLGRLSGKTYGAQTSTSVFQRQLRSWSVLLALGRSEIDRAFRQAFPDLSDALIEEWEQAFLLPNDTVRTSAQRQARLAAHERTGRGAARDSLQDTLDTTGTIAHFTPNRRVDILYAGSEDAAIFQTALQLANEDFNDPIVREAVEILYENSLPAKNVGALDGLGRGWATCVEVGARWNSATHFLNRDAIARQATHTRTEYGQPARVKSYGPGTRLDAEHLNAIQETILGSALDGEPDLLDYSGVTVGLLTYWIGAALAVSPTVNTLDASIDWRDRLIWACLSFDNTYDIVPGGTDDDRIAASEVQHFCLYSGTGHSGTNYEARGVAGGGERLFVNSASGDLEMTATPSAGYIAGIVWATEPLGKRP